MQRHNAVQILQSFGQVKAMLEDQDKRTSMKGKKHEPSPEEVKWMKEMNAVMIALRDEFICTSTLKVTQLMEIFDLSNQRIYQIKGRQKKAA